MLAEYVTKVTQGYGNQSAQLNIQCGADISSIYVDGVLLCQSALQR